MISLITILHQCPIVVPFPFPFYVDVISACRKPESDRVDVELFWKITLSFVNNY